MPDVPKDPLSETQVERIAVKIEQREAATPRSRIVEDILAFAGIIQALFYGGMEALRSAGFKLGDCPTEHSFPWVTIAILAICVAPKTVGRATAGKAWAGLAGMLPSGGKNA